VLRGSSVITLEPAIDHHFKTANGIGRDVIVLPYWSVRLKGLGLSPQSGVCCSGFALPGLRLAE
jgi:hypothetical protein